MTRLVTINDKKDKRFREGTVEHSFNTEVRIQDRRFTALNKGGISP